MMKKNHVAVAVTLALGAAGVQAATTNSAATIPNVLIGSTTTPVVLGNIQLIEGGAAQLSASAPADTFYIQLPTGVYFSDTTVTAAVTSSGTALTLASANATVSDTDGDSKNDRATWNISAQSATAGSTIVISSIGAYVASTVAAGDIAVTIGSNTPGNPGLTAGTVVDARAVVAGTTNELTGTAPNVHIGGTAEAGGTLQITESATGTLASGKTITVDLPTGVSFQTAPVATATNMTLSSATGSLSNSSRTSTWTVASGGASSGSNIGQIKIPTTLAVGSTVAAGAINATIGGTASVTAGTVQVATAATGATTASAVNTTLGKTPAGRSGVAASNVLIKENFGEVVSDAGSATITLTLPDGVTFAAAPSFTTSQGGTATVSSSQGFSTSTITIPQPGGTDSVATTYTISNLSVNVASSVAAGDLSVAIAGSTGSGVTAASVPVLNVVASSVTVTPNTTIPTLGIGGNTQAIGAFTIKEDVASALLANSSTITLSLPAGVTWSAAPSVTSSVGGMLSSTVTLSSDSQTATATVATASSSAATITVAGNVNVASTVAAGDIAVTVGGTAGASGSATVATAAQGTTTAISSITSLTAGTPTQSIGTISVSESFAGAIAANGQFRVVLPSGLTWATATPSVTTALVTTGGSGTKLVATVDTTNSYSGTTTTGANWEFERGTTFTSNDTLIVRGPSSVSTGATKVSFAGLKVNVASTAADGNVQVSIVDGDLSAANGAGVIGSTETVAVIGTALALTADSTAVTVNTNATGTVTLSGGVGALSISTQPDSTVATASLVNGVLTVTPVAAGTTSIVVSDSASTPSTVTIGVTVTQAADLIDTTTPTTLSGAATNATISAGVTGDGGATQTLTDGSFTAADSLDVTASIAVDPNDVGQDGSILVLAGLDQGSGITWYMKDSTGAWLPWDGTPANLVAADGPRALAATESVSVATGLSGLTGDFTVFVGYEIGSEIIYTTTPITFTVQ